MVKLLDNPGGLPECPYFHLKALDFGRFALRLHFWHGDDDHRAYHDHRHWFLTFVLRGGYVDVSPRPDGPKRDRLRIGSIRFRRADYRHTVTEVQPGTITFLITGPPMRRWSFYDIATGKAWRRDKWFAEQGHHACKQTESPVRLRPDGTRIDVDKTVAMCETGQ